MQLNISMTNFRCFAEVGPVRVAPITLLIGENSAGKTSFLAGIREIVEAFNAPSGHLFNREPFFLGSFEQIAHYRGGRSGRAKTFSLEVEILSNPGQADLFSNRRANRVSSHRLTFEKGDTQPQLSLYETEAREASAVFDLSGSRPSITINRPGEGVFELQPDRAPSSYLMRREIAFLGFYLSDLARRSNTPDQIDTEEASTAAIRSLGSALRQAAQTMRRSVFASAPVRYQPRRVYIPSELTSQNAGEQVPVQMANLKLSSPEKWAATKDRLNSFGHRSGLFDDIDVKRFGKTTSDPFQLQIKNSGPASNIADVGYGVSQALPILFPLQEEGDFDFFLLQQPEVHLHPKAQAEFGSLIASLSATHPRSNYIIETHSDYILDRIRSEVRDGTVPPAAVSILLFRRQGLDVSILQMGINEHGEITDYPEDYREFFLEEQARILGV